MRCDLNVVKLMVFSGYYLIIDEVEQCNRCILIFFRFFRCLVFLGIDILMNGFQMMVWLKEWFYNLVLFLDICWFSIWQLFNKGLGDILILLNIRKFIFLMCLKEYIVLDEFSYFG